MDIAHLEITMALLQILAYLKFVFLRVLMRFILQDSQLSKTEHIGNLSIIYFKQKTYFSGNFGVKSAKSTISKLQKLAFTKKINPSLPYGEGV